MVEAAPAPIQHQGSQENSLPDGPGKLSTIDSNYLKSISEELKLLNPKLEMVGAQYLELGAGST